MHSKILLLIKKHTGTLIEQIKTRPQETLEIKLNKKSDTFYFSLPNNLSSEGREEGK